MQAENGTATPALPTTDGSRPAQTEMAAPASCTLPPLFERIAIVGIGMMGGSLGLALRAKGVAQNVAGVDTQAAILARGVEIGAIDAGTTDLQAGVAHADCVILAAPVAAMPGLLQALVPFVRADALITDIGSVKREIVAAGEYEFGERFVGGHPMAGSPQGGINAAQQNLFINAPWIIARSRQPDLREDVWAAKLAELVERLGAHVLLMDSARHDRLAAFVSHLPHVLAFAFADTLADLPDADDARQMAGGSYRDLMRVSSADRAFWQAIFRANRDELRTALDVYEHRVHMLRRLLDAAED